MPKGMTLLDGKGEVLPILYPKHPKSWMTMLTVNSNGKTLILRTYENLDLHRRIPRLPFLSKSLRRMVAAFIRRKIVFICKLQKH